MKKLFLMFMTFLMMSVCVNAQEVTTFMGIPIDGTKSEIIPKLIKKGFKKATFENYLGFSESYYRNLLGDAETNRYKESLSNMLLGEFNGKNSVISIVYNRNKVYRIVVNDRYEVNESQIKINYNNLLYQFKNSAKYVSYDLNNIIDEDELINYQMSIYNKQYQSIFYQNGDHNRVVWFSIDKNVNGYRLFIYYDNIYNQANGEDL